MRSGHAHVLLIWDHAHCYFAKLLYCVIEIRFLLMLFPSEKLLSSSQDAPAHQNLSF